MVGRPAKAKIQQPQTKSSKIKYDEPESIESSDDGKQHQKNYKAAIKNKLQDHPRPSRIQRTTQEVIEVDVFEEKPTKKVKPIPKKTEKLSGVKSNPKKIKINSRFYPEKPHLVFPEGLQENLLKVVASLENKGNIQDVLENLARFYTNDLNHAIFGGVLRHYEEDGIISERDGIYAIHHGFVPALAPLSVEVIAEEHFKIQMEQEDDDQVHNHFKNDVLAKDEDLLAVRDLSAEKLFGDDHNKLYDNEEGEL